nr:MAG TPA_asm: hypothetical protein [Caudoviricetes sp.]
MTLRHPTTLFSPCHRKTAHHGQKFLFYQTIEKILSIVKIF